MVAIRNHLAIRPYDHATQQLLETVLREAAQTKDDLVDLINIGIEELIRQRYELPGFTTLRRTAQRARAEINRALFQQVATVLETAGTPIVDQLLQVDAATRQAPWNYLKADPGRPTLTQLRDLVTHLHWLTSLNVGATAFATVPAVKVHQFATEARSLDAARMQRLAPAKRATLAAALVKTWYQDTFAKVTSNLSFT